MSATTGCLVIHPQIKAHHSLQKRSPQAQLEEAVGLARAISLAIVDARVIPIDAIRPATYLGKGQVEALGGAIRTRGVGVIIVDASLSPVQQRNLEKEWACKVIDRTALILEIFGARARTREGKLQVELASLTYQKSRLVRSWTHLERQRGGFGFLGGPGESQIEVDRRLISDRITKIRRQLETVTRTRELHRKVRREIPYPIVALVGYTNAGKSTLFNRLTGAKVSAEDKLFATLDPTLRSVRLPSGLTILLSDTVGFVSDLPHELVAAFRATLEEVVEADLILHVRDISHPDSTAQREDVLLVLRGLLDEQMLSEQMLEVHNKIDQRENLEDMQLGLQPSGAIAISALRGDGVEDLLTAIDHRLADRFFQSTRLSLPVADGKALAWLHAHGNVISTEEDGDQLMLEVRLSQENLARFQKQFSHHPE